MMRLRRYFFIILFAVLCLTTEAQTQFGFVRTLKRSSQKSQPLSGVTIRAKGGHNAVLSKEDGTFGIQIQGQAYILEMIRKQGYELKDPEMQGRRYAYSSSVPLTIVMASKKQLQADRQKISDMLYTQGEQRYLSQIRNLEQQLKANGLTVEKYRQQMLELQENYEKYPLIIEDLADHYAHVDYDDLDENETAINQCIENGELEKAYSLIQQLGILQQVADIEKKLEAGRLLMENAAQDKAAVLKQQERDANNLYNLYTIAMARFDNKQAQFYIETRAELDTTNIKWQLDAANYLYKFRAEYNGAIKYFQRALKLTADKQEIATIYYGLGEVMKLRGNLTLSLEYHKKSLSIRRSFFHNRFELYNKDTDTENSIFFRPKTELAQSYHALGAVYSSLGENQKAYESLNESKNLYSRLASNSLHDEKSKLIMDIGDYDLKYGEYEKALSSYYSAHINYKNYDNLYSIGSADCYLKLCDIYLQRGEYSKAQENCGKALTVYKKLLGEKHPKIADCYNYLGQICYKNQKNKGALHYFTKSDSIYNCFYEDHISLANLYDNIGYLLLDESKYSESMEYFSKSKTIKQNIKNSIHESLAKSYRAIGRWHFKQKHLDEAISNYNMAIEIFDSLFNEKNVFAALLYRDLGEYALEHRDYAEALDCYKESLSILESLFGKIHPDIAAVYNKIGLIYYKKREYNTALGFFFKYLSVYKDIFGENSYKLSTAYSNIAAAYKQLKDYNKALEYYKKRLDLHDTIQDKDSISIANLFKTIGDTYDFLHDYTNAYKYYLKAVEIYKNKIGKDHPSTITTNNCLNQTKQKIGQ